MLNQEQRFALLKQWKSETDLTYDHLASVTDIPVSSVQRIIEGRTPNPTFSNVAKIVVALGHTLDEYYGLEKDGKEITMVSLLKSSMEQQLHEKDIILELRLKEKDALIASLEKEKEYLKKDKEDTVQLLEKQKEYLKRINSKQMTFIICFIAFLFLIVGVFIVDLTFPEIGRFN